MTLTEKLLGYLNRVFNKDPESVLALRLNYDGVMTWHIAGGTLTTTVTGGSGSAISVVLAGFDIAGLAGYLALQPGYSVPYVVSGDMSTRSALALIETSGNPSQSNGDHMLAFQSVLWAYLGAQAAELSTAQVAIGEALLQIAALTASDTWVDEHGNYYGIARRDGEADVAYAARIVSEITQARGNGVAIAEAVKLAATASYVTVTDYAAVTVSGGGVGSYGLFDVDVEVPVESPLSQPQIESNTESVLEAMRDAGTHIRNLRYIRTATMRLWTGGYSRAGHYMTLGFDRFPFLLDGSYLLDGTRSLDGGVPASTGSLFSSWLLDATASSSATSSPAATFSVSGYTYSSGLFTSSSALDGDASSVYTPDVSFPNSYLKMRLKAKRLGDNFFPALWLLDSYNTGWRVVVTDVDSTHVAFLLDYYLSGTPETVVTSPTFVMSAGDIADVSFVDNGTTCTTSINGVVVQTVSSVLSGHPIGLVAMTGVRSFASEGLSLEAFELAEIRGTP